MAEVPRNLSPTVIGRTIAHYHVEEHLGEGGMGRVYRARDTRLGRSVALKFMALPASGDVTAQERFLQEARTASSLDHPNICTVYDIGETPDGELYIAMAYYPGQSLARRLEAGPLVEDEALSVATQIACGLGRSHQWGIVHRDVKPGNVMITEEGLVKILDFGIAKLEGSTPLTESGALLGTPAYMAPEQVRGEEADHRADIWSLGVVLYEMLTGVSPFRRDSRTATLYAIVHDDPLPLTSLRPGLSPQLQSLVDGSLAKEPSRRYPSIDLFLAALERAARRDAPGDSPSTLVMTDPGLAGGGEAVPVSVAVLPFSDLSPSHDQLDFCDGVADEILTALSRVQGLRVAARMASFQFRGFTGDPGLVADRLRVDHLLEGSVRKQGNRLRVTVQLVHAGDGSQLWSEQYDRELEDVFAVQEDIAERTVEALSGMLSEEDRRALGERPAVDVHAYEHYLRARQQFWAGDRTAIEEARSEFRRSLENDSDFARAWAGLADCHCWLYYWNGGRDEDLEAAQAASRRAVEVGAGLAETRLARGNVLALLRRFDEAEAEMQQALRIDPRYFEAHWFYGRLCWSLGRLEEAARLFEQAASVRPEDFQSLLVGCAAYDGLGRPAEARSACERGLARARRQLELEPNNVRALALGGGALVDLGEIEEGKEWVERALRLSRGEPWVFYSAACTFACLGEHERALEHLEAAVEAGIRHREWLEHDPDMDPLREEPGFQALLYRMG